MQFFAYWRTDEGYTGGSDDPNVFNPQMFSFRRMVVAPVVILAGIVFEIWAIMHVGKKDREEQK